MCKQLLQDWVTNLELKDQATLVAILRGCDNESVELKLVTKMLRKLIVNDFNKMTNYTADKVFSMSTIHRNIMLGQFLNKHWYDHVKKAIFIVSDKHPELYTRSYWDGVYDEILSSERDDKDAPHVKRMKIEEIELRGKIEKLNKYVTENDYSDDQMEQLFHMSKYYDILCKRLGFENNIIYCDKYVLYQDFKGDNEVKQVSKTIDNSLKVVITDAGFQEQTIGDLTGIKTTCEADAMAKAYTKLYNGSNKDKDTTLGLLHIIAMLYPSVYNDKSTYMYTGEMLDITLVELKKFMYKIQATDFVDCMCVTKENIYNYTRSIKDQLINTPTE